MQGLQRPDIIERNTYGIYGVFDVPPGIAQSGSGGRFFGVTVTKTPNMLRRSKGEDMLGVHPASPEGDPVPEFLFKLRGVHVRGAVLHRVKDSNVRFYTRIYTVPGLFGVSLDKWARKVS
jgi:hypothetical protein